MGFFLFNFFCFFVNPLQMGGERYRIYKAICVMAYPDIILVDYLGDSSLNLKAAKEYDNQVHLSL